MSDLYPTKNRLELLSEVAAGNVIEGITYETAGHTWLTTPLGTERPRKVCARIAEMEQAGWVEHESPPFWKLTDAGRAVLDANGGAS